jgi:hypothetical protein
MMIMRKSYRVAMALLMVLVLVAAGRQVGYSQSQDREVFPTGHAVEGAFLAYYRLVPNPELVYGYPITGAFTRTDGLRVQYFQRARFELGLDRVVRTPIGDALYEAGRPLSGFNDRPAVCRSFDSGFRVCGDFLAFFDEHGGQAQFGLPRSLVEADGVRQVQYFDYARLEWYPESAEPGLQVRIGDLGRLYFEFEREDLGHLVSDRSNGIIEITELRLHAFPATAAVRGEAAQQVFIIVRDQNFAAVAGMEVAVTIRYPNGQLETYPAVTNEHGFAEFNVPLDPARFGEGRVYVGAAGGISEISESAQTSFWSTR